MSKYIFYLIIFLLSKNLYADYNWPRYPSDSEIENAVSDYLNGENRKTDRISSNYYIVKYHSQKLSQRATSEGGLHSRALLIIEEVYSQFGQTFSEFHIYTLTYGKLEISYNVYSNDSRFQFSQSANFFYNTPYYMKKYDNLGNMRNDVLSVINTDPDLEIGFADINNLNNNNSENYPNSTEDYSGPMSNSDSQDDEIPWEVIIGGAIGGGALLAIRKKLKANKNKAPKNKTNNKKDDEEEDAGYILQLSAGKFELILGEPQFLEIRVIKVTETSQKSIQAAIQIQNTETALALLPDNGTTPLTCQLLLQKPPQNQNFNITISAQADGHQFQKQVQINLGGDYRIVYETAPDNIRTLRPDINRYLTLLAQVQNVKGEAIDDLTNTLVFSPIGDWAEISDPVWDDNWAAIHVGASNPNVTSISSHPPATMEVLIQLDRGDDKDILEEKLVVQLLDCFLESELYNCTFPAIEQKQQLEFKVWIENAGDEKNWNFKHQYRIGVDTEDEPLTDVSFEKINDTTMLVKLVGPILLPSEGNNIITKTLVISAFQGQEKPIESHITVSVSSEGLFLDEGFKNGNELHATAKGEIEEKIVFSLYDYDERTKQILPNAKGLKQLTFDLQNDDIAAKNIHDILEINFFFDELIVNNLTKARYYWEIPKKFPGFGDIHELNYEVSAPIPSHAEHPEVYKKKIKMLVRSYGMGEEFPEWQIAYKNCQDTIWEYIPDSTQRKEMLAKLEEHKHKLDVEGLVKFRKMIWGIAHDLIINERDGYLSIANWCDAIIDTLDWLVWMGDLAFQVLLATFTGPTGALAASAFKETFLTAVTIVIEGKSLDDFIKSEMTNLEAMMYSVAKGKVINTQNIESVYKGSKWKVWAIFAGATFAAFYYKTGSIPEAAKMTARELRDEAIIRFLSVETNKIRLQREASANNNSDSNHKDISINTDKKPKIKSERVQKKLEELESEIKTNRIGGKFIDKSKVLEIMGDPALVRTIKNHGSPELKKAFDGPRQKIYNEHDRMLIDELARELRMNPNDLEVDDFRTPGDTGENLNTDRDYRVVRKVKLENGEVAKIEVSRKVFEAKSQRIFGQLTDKPPHISDAEWATSKQQMATDFTFNEGSIDYSDQGIDPETGKRIQIKSNIENVKEGKTVLKNPDSMGQMYKNKVNNAGERPEKYAQAQKATKSLKNVKKGYDKQNYKTTPESEKLEKAMKIIDSQPTDVDMTPQKMAETHKKLQDLGYENGLKDVMKDIDSEFKNLKSASKKGIFERMFG